MKKLFRRLRNYFTTFSRLEKFLLLLAGFCLFMTFMPKAETVSKSFSGPFHEAYVYYDTNEKMYYTADQVIEELADVKNLVGTKIYKSIDSFRDEYSDDYVFTYIAGVLNKYNCAAICESTVFLTHTFIITPCKGGEVVVATFDGGINEL